VLIRDLKIARAGVFFPMPETKILDAALGSRHRAALGITEETDAVVVVVSEERGTISFCFSGNIVSNLDGQSLRQALLGLFGRAAARNKKTPAAKKLGTSMASVPPAVPPQPAAPTPRPNTIPPSPAPARTPVPVGPIQVRERDYDREAAPISVRSASKLVTSTPMRPAEPRTVTDPRPATASEGSGEKSPDGSQSIPPGARAATFVPSSPSVPPPPPVPPAPPASPPSGDES
jgi:hypothetical protein